LAAALAAVEVVGVPLEILVAQEIPEAQGTPVPQQIQTRLIAFP